MIVAIVGPAPRTVRELHEALTDLAAGAPIREVVLRPDDPGHKKVLKYAADSGITITKVPLDEKKYEHYAPYQQGITIANYADAAIIFGDSPSRLDLRLAYLLRSKGKRVHTEMAKERG
jgi:hypothetical protein